MLNLIKGLAVLAGALLFRVAETTAYVYIALVIISWIDRRKNNKNRPVS